jgi:hypothetical protein
MVLAPSLTEHACAIYHRTFTEIFRFLWIPFGFLSNVFALRCKLPSLRWRWLTQTSAITAASSRANCVCISPVIVSETQLNILSSTVEPSSGE